jgi:hypothetical protein
VEQTNRTLLFEQINPGVEDIITLIGITDEKKSLTDEDIKEIHNKLAVSSFRDFLHKFNPAIFMQLDTQNKQENFSKSMFKKASKNTVTIKLNEENRFFSMLVHMLDSRRKNNEMRESFEDMVDYMFPEHNFKEFLRLRKQLKTQFLKYYESKDDRTYQTLEETLELLVSNYDNGLFLLQLFLNEARRIMFDKQKESKYQPVILENSQNSQIKVLEMSEVLKEKEAYLSGDAAVEFRAFINENIEQKQINNKELLLYNLTARCAMNEEEAYRYSNSYNEYMEYYARMIRRFWLEAKPMLQTILGIKAFFEQYDVENGLMPPSLIITNCSPKVFLNEKNRQRFGIYMETVNQKNFHDEAIWYAIIPRLPFDKEDGKTLTRERFKGNEHELIQEVNSEETIHLLLKILTEYKVQVFLSVNSSQGNTFGGMAGAGISVFEEAWKPFYKADNKELLIPCMPNFTLIPNEHANLVIGNKSKFNEESKGEFYKTDKKIVWLEGIYIEASYIAAGLVAACQCPKYLQQYFKNQVDMEVPGVAYRFMNNENSKKTTAKMAKEIFGYPLNVCEEIERKSYGFVFTPQKGGIGVMTDRTMAYMNGDNDCIATVQTITYIERVIRYATQDFRSNLIVEFFQNRPNTIKSKWMQNQKSVNSIIKQEETLEYEIDKTSDSCTFKIGFKELDKGKTVAISK